MGVFSAANCVSSATKFTGLIPLPFLTPQHRETLEKNFQLAYFHVVPRLCREQTARGSQRPLLEQHVIKIWQKGRRMQLCDYTNKKKIMKC